MVELEEKEDRISDLTDDLIHHIISFLPSTKQAIQTGVLSKRWHKQWTHVQVLVFKSDGMSAENFLRLTDNTLLIYDCFKIKKFYLDYNFSSELDPQFDAKIHFATSRNVEELILKCHYSNGKYMLPEFLFDNASLVKLDMFDCTFRPTLRVNWECVKQLKLRFCTIPNEAIELVLSGSPLLEFLELNFCRGFNEEAIIASKSLKRLVLVDHPHLVPGILCPNLEELVVKGDKLAYRSLFNQSIENVLCGSPLLESLKLYNCDGFDQLVIATKSLRRLVLEELRVSAVQISCPNLEELYIKGDYGYLILSNQMIENVLCDSPLLKSLVLHKCYLHDQLVIAAESLRRLVLRSIQVSVIGISCPNLEELELEYLQNIETFKLMNVPSSICYESDSSINWRKGSIHWYRILRSLHQSRSSKWRRWLSYLKKIVKATN